MSSYREVKEIISERSWKDKIARLQTLIDELVLACEKANFYMVDMGMDRYPRESAIMDELTAVVAKAHGVIQ